MNVWQVKFQKRWFLSTVSTVMLDHFDCAGIVLTRGENLAEVRTAIEVSLTNQERLMELNEATWLGKSLNKVKG